MSKKKTNVAIVSLGFGAEFIPLWQKHLPPIAVPFARAMGKSFVLPVRTAATRCGASVNRARNRISTLFRVAATSRTRE